MPISDPRTPVTDISTNHLDGWYYYPDLTRSSKGLRFSADNRALQLPAFSIPPQITVEEWLVPAFQSSPSRLIEGPLYLRFSNQSRWQFGFGSSVYEAKFKIEPNTRNYVAVSHTFGAGQQTFIAVNGVVAPGSWMSSSYSVSFNGVTNEMTVSFDIPNLSRIRFTTTGALPTGLSVGVDYWTMRQTSTSSKIASSRSNAVSGSFIDFPSSGSGSNTVVVFQGQELPPFAGLPTVSLAVGDILQQLRISSVAKTAEAIKTYYTGLSG